MSQNDFSKMALDFINELKTEVENTKQTYSQPTQPTEITPTTPTITSNKWTITTPKKGDHIRVSRDLYTHHGLYFSNDEIIHFTGQGNDNIADWSENQVMTSTLTEFLRGGTLEVRVYNEEEKKNLLPPDQIHENAKSRLGERGYNLILNNCEHFANQCALGKHSSEQIEDIVSIFDTSSNSIEYNGTLSSAIASNLKDAVNNSSLSKVIDENDISRVGALVYNLSKDLFKN